MTPEDRQRILAELNRHSARGVVVVAGGGSLLLSDLLTTSGASATVLEASVPYSNLALTTYLGRVPDHACSEDTARQLSMVSLQRAVQLNGPSDDCLFGFSITASLATNHPKRGPHRAHLALQTPTTTAHRWMTFEKGKHTRGREERLLADLALLSLSDWLHLEPPLTGQRPESLHDHQVHAEPAWQFLLTNLLGGKTGKVLIQGQDTSTGLLFPGAFDPIHSGHRAMVRRATDIYRQNPAFEICINNVDKPPLDYIDLQFRLQQFEAGDTVWLTSYPTFLEKARAFPGATFMVGIDTLLRIDQPRYYATNTITGAGSNSSHSNRALRDQALLEFVALGCRFLVFPRTVNGVHRTLEDIDLSQPLASLCKSAGKFNHNISSSELREQSGSGRNKKL